MKKLILLIGLVIIAGFFLTQTIKQKVKSDLAKPVLSFRTTPTPSPKIQTSGKGTTSLFVPYWTVADIDMSSEYDHYIYFGVTPGKEGINTTETGALQLEKFLSSVPQGKKTYLTIRMLDSVNNFAVLEKKTLQKKVIQDSITVAKKNGFNGIVLDLELTALPFDSIINQITSFTSAFYSEAQKNSLTFSMTLYGDTFYRLRPFDVKALSGNADSFMIMAYDFHKAKGNPGPNFPLQGKETYGYDMAKATDNFLQFIPANKVNVIFGLFGYDWTVDEKGKAISQGKSLSYEQIRAKFLERCEYAQCIVKRDASSSETRISYTDDENKKHIIWFEDMKSVRTKQKYLQEKGITNFSFWANTYF